MTVPAQAQAAPSSLADRFWAAGYRMRGRVRAGTAWLTRGWHRSLTLRVVLTTLVLSGTVIGLLGWVLLGQSLSPVQILGFAITISAIAYGATVASRVPTEPNRILLVATTAN